MPNPFDTPVADPFMEGGSAPGLKFEEVGQVHSITVRKVAERIDTKPDGEVQTWKDGSPKHVYVFNGEDEDGDPASLWVRGNLVKAIREATAKAGLSTVVDTKVTIKFTGLGTPSQKGFNAPKLYAAKVEKVAPEPIYGNEEPF